MNKIKVLVFPAGEVNSLELHDALATNVNIEIYGASSIDRHGPFKFENYISGLPLITHESFLNQFNLLIKDKGIDLVIPTHDTVAYFFSKNEKSIKAKVLVPKGNTAEICRYKSKTYLALKGESYLPRIFDSFYNTPVFIKPDDGQGGQGAKLVQSPADIPANFNPEKFVICEYLPGEELSVDCFTDKNGKLIVISPRTRQRTMAGITVASQNVELSSELKNIAESINARIHFLGLWFFQVKKDNEGKWKLLEVATRVASSMSLTRAKGFNLPLMSVYAALGKDVAALEQNYNVKMDRTLISRYEIDYGFENVYLDFDDTLIIRDKVYLPAIWLVYQLQNQNKKVILITRHKYDIIETLNRYKIDKSLFADIVHIKDNQPKSNYIKNDKAIFIDNAHQERKEVFESCGIPVFDVDAIEVLMNWRT